MCRIRPSLVLSVSVLLAACAVELTDPRWIEPEGSEEFVAGYRHGCQSGRHKYDPQLTFRIRDPDRYASDEEYTKGWDEGFSLCYEQEKKYPTLLGGNSEI